MRFYSKKGIVVGTILWGMVVLLVSSLFMTPGSLVDGDKLLAALIVVAVSAFIGWLWFNTYYEIDGKNLKIVAGPIRSKVEIKSITTIKRSRNLLSSPALSLIRLQVKYGKWNYALISPKNEELFCKRLKEINPKIDINI
ncbi:MAG: PH domain-containing protein [Neobacillus sp.]